SEMSYAKDVHDTSQKKIPISPKMTLVDS
nr:type I DNA methyltransferase M.EcoR124I chain HsdS - Escherichia coli (fragments) [Escherichia coli]